jgi:TolB-like protein
VLPFSHALHEALISELAQIRALRVIWLKTEPAFQGRWTHPRFGHLVQWLNLEA